MVLLLISVLGLAAALPPIISRVSHGGAAAPNDTLVISGAFLDGGTAILCPLDPAAGGGPCLALPAQPSSWAGGLKVTLPPTSVGAFSLAVCSPAGQCSNASQAQTFSVNAPRVSWVLGTGDTNGDAVEAGGVLRVFGSALALNPLTGVCGALTAAAAPYAQALVPGAFPPGAAAALATPPPGTATTASLCSASGGSCLPLPLPLLASCHRLDLPIPAATPPGEYSLRLHNGLASTRWGLGALGMEAAITITPPRATLPASPVLTLGKDCAALPACLAALPAAGGVVAIPAGVWDVPGDVGVEVRGGVTLVGTAGAASVLRWASNTAAGRPAAALYCTGPSLLSSFTLLLTSPALSALQFAAPGGCRGEALGITFDTLAGGFPAFGIGTAFSASAGSAAWSLVGSTLVHRGNCSGGPSWPHNTAYIVWGSARGLFANNTVACYCEGHSTDSSSRVVFDGNAVFSLGASASQGSGFSTFEEPFVLERVYVGRSLDVGNPAALKRYESMTLDGPGGATFGTLAAPLSSNGTAGEAQTLTLTVPARCSPYGSKNISRQYVGATLSVLYGPGLGGLARVAAFLQPTNGSWQAAGAVRLHPPLLTQPVAGQSWVAINPTRSELVWEGNSYVNDTTWQLWAQATETVLAGSYFEDFSGGGDVRNWALFYQCPWGSGGGEGGFPCAWQPNVASDFIGNTLRCVSGMSSACMCVCCCCRSCACRALPLLFPCRLLHPSLNHHHCSSPSPLSLPP